MNAFIAGLLCGLVVASANAQAQPKSKTLDQARAAHKEAQRKLDVANKPFTGDFGAMLERRTIRVAAPYSRSLFYIDKGKEAGIGARLVRDFETWINKKYASKLGKRPLTVYIVATTRDKLLPNVTSGLADIAVGNLTVTAAREKQVDFLAPDDIRKTNEIVVTGPASPTIASLDDLSGKVVHVRRSSSYHDSLAAQNAKFKAAGKPDMKIVLVPDSLEDEDLMEMVNAGLLPIIVVDDWKAMMWSNTLPKLVLHQDIALREGAKIGWAYRKGSPKLAVELEDFYTSWAKKNGVVPYLMQRAMKSGPLRDPSADRDFKRFEDTVAFFVKYGKQYDFDPVMLAAQGYQESTLDQSKRSHVGAIGVMQVMPATGKELKVGDISVTEANIHAGAKYMDQLMTRYFPDAKFDHQNRTLFAFASYNAGPGNIARMRKEAEKRGLDPNVWFNNVEVVTAEKIGLETTTYVRNIFKYYASYRLVIEAQDRATKAREIVGTSLK
jgi:membrane-bound lytic murein transglycosylase MltF